MGSQNRRDGVLWNPYSITSEHSVAYVCLVGPTEERLHPCCAAVALSTIRFHRIQTK